MLYICNFKSYIKMSPTVNYSCPTSSFYVFLERLNIDLGVIRNSVLTLPYFSSSNLENTCADWKVCNSVLKYIFWGNVNSVLRFIYTGTQNTTRHTMVQSKCEHWNLSNKYLVNITSLQFYSYTPFSLIGHSFDKLSYIFTIFLL